jgi:hypothetical protein
MTDGDELRDSSPEVVSDETGKIDPEKVQHGDQPVSMCAEIDASGERGIAPSVAEQIENDHPVSAWEEWDDPIPEMAGGGEPVQQYDGFARAARARGVVVETDSVYIEELAAHGRS